MSDGVHLLIPFAASSAPACRGSLETLVLPRLSRLLARLVPTQVEDGDEHTLSMPHERALAREFGLEGADGLLPWAAWQVHQSGRDAADGPWAWITPCHWRVNRDNVVMEHPQDLQLDAADSQALLAAMRPYFEEDGFQLEYDAPTLWLARGDMFGTLPTASLDRVVGRVIDAWIPRSAAAKPLRRLQQEMQMMLYTHAVNEERTRGGLLPVNSFWISGTGRLPAQRHTAPPAGLQITHYLRDAALRGDWRAWAAAWQQLDGRECELLLQALERGESVALTLCGERTARTWRSRPPGLWQRLTASLARPQTSRILGDL